MGIGRVYPAGRRAARWQLMIQISAVALALGWSGAAMAQAVEATAAPDQQDASENSTDEIVVTAQFREQKLQDTPLAITAFTGATLEARSQTNIAEVAAQAPSVVLKPTNAAYGPSMTASIRGLGQIDFNPALEPGVGLYIDDVYYPRLTGANLDLLDVERVEILRGPQGTLTGRNSEGGAIKFVSKRPNGEGDGYVAATYGSRNRISLRGSADLKLAEGLFARISGTFADQEGYVSQIDYGCVHPGQGIAATRPAGDCTKSKFGDVGYKALRAIVRYNPSDTIDWMVSGDYMHDQRHAPAEILLFGNSASANVAPAPGVPFDSRFLCGKFCNYAANGQPAGSFSPSGLPLSAFPIDNRSDYKGYGFSSNLTIRPTDALSITSVTAYRKFNSAWSNDPDLSPANFQASRNTLDGEFFSQELRGNVELSSSVEATVGGYYSWERTMTGGALDARYLPPFPLQFTFRDPVTVRSKATFGTVIIKPVAGLTFTGGLRYTRESKSYTYYRYNFDGVTINPFTDSVGAVYGAGYRGPDTLNRFGPPGTTTDIVTSLTGSTSRFRKGRVDYRASVDYRFSPEVLIYATFSTGFKGGGVNPRPFNAAQAVPFGPEVITAYEIGAKTDLFNRKLRLNVAAYLNRLKGAQLTLSTCPQYGPGPCALPANAGNAEVKGVEAEIAFRPIDGLQIDASGSLLDWNWKCVNPQVLGLASTGQCDTAPALVDRLAVPPRGTFKSQWSLGAQYEFDLGSAGSLTPRIDLNHQGRMVIGTIVPVANSPQATFGSVPAYTLANARLTWRNASSDIDISLEVSNLFDKYYFLNKFDFTSAPTGPITGLVGRPREWAISVRKKF